MDFSLSEEQVLLRDSIEKYVREQCDVERHRQLVKSASGFDEQAWQQFAELGWLGMPFSEEDGGYGGNAVDTTVILEALGKGLVREPYLSTVLICGGFLRHGGSDEQRAAFIPDIIEGKAQWAFAFAEMAARYSLNQVAMQASKTDTGFILSGEKLAVLNGHCADKLIVSARTSGSNGDADGISLFIVDASSAGVERVTQSLLDGSKGASVQLKDVVVGDEALLGDLGAGLALMESVIDESIVAMGAEALGAMQSLLDTTVEYTKTREQFGQPIGKFQVLQHRMVDMYLKVEETRSLVMDAAIQHRDGTEQRSLASTALKVKIAEAGKYLSQESVQLHGGIGMTDELIVGHHYKRLMLLGLLFGDEDYYLDRYGRLAG